MGAGCGGFGSVPSTTKSEEELVETSSFLGVMGSARVSEFRCFVIYRPRNSLVSD